MTERFRLSRAGVLNVWQYDEQVFDFADGRLLLRGANGAGKSKTLEMLLPFVLDGDKLRMTASGRHHTSLLWLMTDGYEGTRTGYVWVEFARQRPDGQREVLTCGVGIRASSSARQATTWYFTCPRSVGPDLRLEDESGPLTKERCREQVLPDGQLFEQARSYKAHVGRLLFGLDAGQYDELLRLLYWLRQPQIGEDIEPAKLAEQLAQALPEVDDEALRAAGDTFDELAAFGEQIDRRARAAEGIALFAQAYRSYAQATVRSAGGALVEASRELGRRVERVRDAETGLQGVVAEVEAGEQELAEAERQLTAARAREQELEASPEARSQRELLELDRRARETAETAGRAETTAGKARDGAQAAEQRLAADAAALRGDVVSAAAGAGELVTRAARAGVQLALALPASLGSPVLTSASDIPVLGEAVRAQGDAVLRLRAGLGELLAAVQVVDAARVEAEQAAAVREADEQRAAEAERRAERERGRRADAARLAAAVEQEFAGSLEQWQADPRAVPVEVTELTAAAVLGLPSTARAAAAPALVSAQHEQSVAGAARVSAERALAALRAERRVIEAQSDPAPPLPAVERSARDGLDGAPLWRLVAPREQVPWEVAAAVEAALEASGLLDAWVRPDGSVLGPERLDVVLAADAADDARTGDARPGDESPDHESALHEVLRVEPGAAVPEAVVTGLLRRIAVVDDVAAGAGDAVDLRGGWRLGPLVGRARKPVLQYLGATARAQERLRRLADVDARLTVLDAERIAAAAAEAAARARLQQLEQWLAEVPPGQPVLTAWTVLDERTAGAERAEQEAVVAEQLATAARARAADRRRQLQQLGDARGLPITADGLAARREQLRGLDTDVARHVDRLPALGRALDRWAQDAAATAGTRAQAEELLAEAEVQRTAAADAAERRDTVREAAGAGVQELERRLRDTRNEIGQSRRRLQLVRPRLDSLRERLGQARSQVGAAQERVRDHAPALHAATQSLATLVDVPGLVPAALSAAEVDPAAFEQARGVALGDAVPAAVVRLARQLAEVPEPTRSGEAASVYSALQAAASSDAGDAEPRVVPYGPLLAALGRDEAGEHPVVLLAERLGAAVERDRALLTDRERSLFEEHLVGDLGELLRSRRVEAEELVEGMNRLLAGVTTSQGIAVRLAWQLRDDVPEDARRAVGLLGRAVTSLTPPERSELRDALHRLIEASRAEAPEDAYAEHLARALDYRRWSVFHIRYTRPEYDGAWKDLHRRSPLSQGEQKVVCYLPLFAAAAAHFTSLAGAAPHAPRFVLLDDAFPKIDVRTHPLLFGLLVDLDLDFVITSERLWGDHATVPSLAIYEALRDPAQRGVAQYRYTWDGARLTAVGA